MKKKVKNLYHARQLFFLRQIVMLFFMTLTIVFIMVLMYHIIMFLKVGSVVLTNVFLLIPIMCVLSLSCFGPVVAWEIFVKKKHDATIEKFYGLS